MYTVWRRFGRWEMRRREGRGQAGRVGRRGREGEGGEGSRGRCGRFRLRSVEVHVTI